MARKHYQIPSGQPEMFASGREWSGVVGSGRKVVRSGRGVVGSGPLSIPEP